MVRVSDPVAKLCCDFEEYFRAHSKQMFQYRNPRTQLLQGFFGSYDINLLNRNCPFDHVKALTQEIVSLFCIVRLFHHMKLIILKLKKNKRGNELSKDKKLNF